jgi:hypothetical protein
MGEVALLVLGLVIALQLNRIERNTEIAITNEGELLVLLNAALAAVEEIAGDLAEVMKDETLSPETMDAVGRLVGRLNEVAAVVPEPAPEA